LAYKNFRVFKESPELNLELEHKCTVSCINLSPNSPYRIKVDGEFFDNPEKVLGKKIYIILQKPEYLVYNLSLDISLYGGEKR
jgi:hypothetical protein